MNQKKFSNLVNKDGRLISRRILSIDNNYSMLSFNLKGKDFSGLKAKSWLKEESK